ncbi:phosphatase PAP2 family protein [Candidatus Woesearchaeota archaeon]|nr:phosphatase PAP2 family protein [Candidatus Woesearchaeota archaeon]
MPSELIKRQKGDFFRDFSALGSLWIYAAAALFLLAFKNYELLKKLAAGLVLIYAIVIAVRTFYFKERPHKYPHNSYIEKLDASSFPSLHSARTAFLAAVFVGYFNNAMSSILLILMALIILYSRIYLKKHDYRDILAGVIVGIIVYFTINFIY